LKGWALRGYIMSETLQFVVFRVGDEEFAVDIKRVKEIIRVREATRIPRTPSYIQGVINLRGDVIPVIDLRRRFELESIEVTGDTRTIIIEVGKDLVGFIVDSVTEVLRIVEDEVEPPPNNVAGLRSEYLLGVGKVDGRLIIILDVDKLLIPGQLSIT
jgi:purine-binding chemotaxis protein CheW